LAAGDVLDGWFCEISGKVLSPEHGHVRKEIDEEGTTYQQQLFSSAAREVEHRERRS
jgi:hypothetical protein